MALFSRAQAAAPLPVGSRVSTSRWAVLALLCVAQLMIVLDVTIVNIALPSAQQALHLSIEDRQWVVTAYALTFGSLLLFGGKLGDLFGRKRTLVAGLLGFAGASALGGLAIVAGALSGYLTSHPGVSASSAVAAVHSYTVGFTAGALIFAVGLLIALVVLPSRRVVQARSGTTAETVSKRRASARLDLLPSESPDRSDAA